RAVAAGRSDEARRLCAIQAGTGKRSCVDFHSFRRAFVTATGRAGELSLAEKMRLSNHKDERVWLAYQPGNGERLVIPAGAVPKVLPPSTAKHQWVEQQSLNDFERARQDSNLRPMAPEAIALSS